jgi:hypothetical protein
MRRLAAAAGALVTGAFSLIATVAAAVKRPPSDDA